MSGSLARLSKGLRERSRSSADIANGAGNPINPSNLRLRSFKPLLNRAKLPDIRFHDLRHTTASIALSNGVSPKVIQAMLGHANISITLDTYSHLLDGMEESAADGLDEALGLP